MNTAKTVALMAAMTALFLVVGFFIGGQTGIVIAFVIALGMNAIAYWNSDKMVLRLQGARPITREESPEYYELVENLVKRAELPVPKLYVIDVEQPNAFATGRNPENAAVAATLGLLKLLTRDEIEGVIAHELAHVKNRDTLTMTVTATFAGAISMLANFGMLFGRGRSNSFGPIGTIAMVFLAPMAAMVVQSAVSRTREFEADKLGAAISGKPLALASALRKIAAAAKKVMNPNAQASPAHAHMFIINPLFGVNFGSLFSTHPAVETRISELEQLARAQSVGMELQPESSGPWG